MTTRSLVMIAMFTAITVVLGFVPPIMLSFFPVPVHAQFMGILLAGVILGARDGTLSALLLLVLVAIGLPVLSGGRGGLSVFFGPTAGYLVGFVAAAFVTGLMSDRVTRQGGGSWKLFAGYLVAGVCGVIACHLMGIGWLSAYVGLSPVDALIGNMIFVPGDLIKAAISAYAGCFVVANYGSRRPA